jgi:hypothetical protein
MGKMSTIGERNIKLSFLPNSRDYCTNKTHPGESEAARHFGWSKTGDCSDRRVSGGSAAATSEGRAPRKAQRCDFRTTRVVDPVKPP